MDYKEIRAKALDQWEQTLKDAARKVKELDALSEMIRIADNHLKEETPLNVRALFNPLVNLRNKLHRRRKQI